ncbi:hypothetical protein [Halovivax gelatinilyticus]|uniref:hypothetical protein n=1 Tax=Halovivax gelatinilyticus TaxID=2961597 RepID=UPI0020CA28FB|nr:hypothetical protein [Halovivax gelatinilyticus]
MNSSESWAVVSEQLDALEPGSELETPVSGRRFEIESVTDDCVEIRFVDSGEERSLWREQFDVLAERFDEHPISIRSLQPGVEPYATVLSLSPVATVDGEYLAFDPDAASGGESPYLVSPADARTAPTRVHDDALLLAEHLDRLDVEATDRMDTTSVTDCYVLSSDVQHGANRLRKTFRDELLDRLGPEQELHGRFGTVRRTVRERRSVREEEAVFEALDERAIPREWVLGIDRTKLDVVCSVTDLEESEVFDVDERVYVQKTGVDEGEKFDLLAGVRDRLTELEGDEGEAIRDELTDIESRIEAALDAD